MQQAETSALEQIRQQLGDAFLRGRAPHAILLEGGETDALAAWISAAAVCTNAESAPDAKKHLAEFIRIFILQAEAVRRGRFM